jgi:hypothetical protein
MFGGELSKKVSTSISLIGHLCGRMQDSMFMWFVSFVIQLHTTCNSTVVQIEQQGSMHAIQTLCIEDGWFFTFCIKKNRERER